MTDFPKIGDKFGAFLITGKIGHGGMGVVFAAQQEPLGRSVALKVLDPRFTDDPGFVARFKREAELLSSMNSPHVVQVYEHGQLDGCLYLAMQHVSGGDLARYVLLNGPLPPGLAADLTGQVAAALADAHALGIVHRDIKPSNVLLARSGEEPFAYLCDFGIARGQNPALTSTGLLPGSLAFTAPERHEGRVADARSDIYSLGCLLWVLLSGRNPYAGTDFQIAQQHFTAPIPQLPGSGPVDMAINRLLSRMMAKDPAERPATAVEVLAETRKVQRLADHLAQEDADPAADTAGEPTRLQPSPSPAPQFR